VGHAYRRGAIRRAAAQFLDPRHLRQPLFEGEGEDVRLMEVPVDYITSISFTLTTPNEMYIDLDDGTDPTFSCAAPDHGRPHG
jgi:hypothetical protein